MARGSDPSKVAASQDGCSPASPPRALEVLWPCLSSWAFCLVLDIEREKRFAFEARSDLWSQSVTKVGGDNKTRRCTAPLFLSQ